MGDERFASVDFLRVLAIGLIIAFHFIYPYFPDDRLRSLGLIGISLFFIISGFLLANNYPANEKFSVKWFLKRYLKIASLYYPALIAIVLIFGEQVYSGSLSKNLFLHFAFLDFISKETSFGIISTAWFLVPLMAFYLAFPYLNRLVKRYNYSISLIFAAALLFRFYKGGLISFNPLFFLGEFCFGILFAHDKKNIFLFSSLLMFAYGYIFFIPFAVFYLFYYLNFNFIAKMLKFIGKNTLPLFLFHESVIMIAVGSWKVDSLNEPAAIFLIAIVSIFLTYISSKINKFICRKYFKSDNSKMRKESINPLEILFIIFSLLVIGYFVYIINAPPSEQEGGLASLKPGLTLTNKPVLAVSIESQGFKEENGACFSIVRGNAENMGDETAEEAVIRCKPSIYPPAETKIEASKQAGSISPGQKSSFEIETEIKCGDNIKFNCMAECEKC